MSGSFRYSAEKATAEATLEAIREKSLRQLMTKTTQVAGSDAVAQSYVEHRFPNAEGRSGVRFPAESKHCFIKLVYVATEAGNKHY